MHTWSSFSLGLRLPSGHATGGRTLRQAPFTGEDHEMILKQVDLLLRF